MFVLLFAYVFGGAISTPGYDYVDFLIPGIIIQTMFFGGFILIFPPTFVSSAFVPVDSMPAGLQALAEVNPFTVTVDAMRALFLGAPAGNSIWGAVAWAIGIAALFSFLSVARYKRAVSA